jgi:hypothetical protein
MSEHDVVKTPVRSISSLILRISVTRPGFNDATLMVKMYPNTPFTAVRAHLRENYSRFTNFGLMMGAQYVFDSDTPNSVRLARIVSSSLVLTSIFHSWVSKIMEFFYTLMLHTPLT